jgi:hypothetical protein
MDGVVGLKIPTCLLKGEVEEQVVPAKFAHTKNTKYHLEKAVEIKRIKPSSIQVFQAKSPRKATKSIS